MKKHPTAIGKSMCGWKTALLICNGGPPTRTLVHKLASKADLIVAADGGANAARRLGIRPDVIIGDLDSVTQATKRTFASSKLVRVRSQYSTDLEKALKYIVSRKIREAFIVGATGRRIDHTLGNLHVLWNYTSKLKVTVFGDGWKAMPVESGRRVVAKVGTIISLIPFGACGGITLRGLRYPLTNATMRVGEIGLSNVVRKSPFRVIVRRGRMLMFVMGDSW